MNVRSRWSGQAAWLQNLVEVNDSIKICGFIAENFAPYYPANAVILDAVHSPIFGPAFKLSEDTINEYRPLDFTFANNQYVVAGAFGRGNPARNAFFLSVNSDFTRKVFRTFTDTVKRTNFFKALFVTDTGTVILINQYQLKSLNFQSDIALYKLDFNGNLIWMKEYPQSTGSLMNAQKVCAYKNGYLLAGELHYYPSSFYNQSPKLFFTDTSGNLLWQRVLDDSIDGIHDWVINDDHSIVYCSKWGDSISQSQNLYTRAYLAKLDSNQNKVWEYRMGLSTLGTSYEAITKTKDGSYIAVGVGVSLPTDTGARGTLIKFKDRGDSISVQWQRYYRAVTPKTSVNYLYDVIERSNGSIVACGKSECSSDTFPQQGWILGLDSFGCLVPGCQNWNAIADMPTKAQLRLYPNPVQSVLYFDVSGIGNKKDCMVTISDGSGRQLAHIPAIDADTEYIADTKNYAQGIYFLKLYDHDQLMHVARFVKK